MLKFCFILVFFIVFIIPLPVSNAYLKLNYENYRHEIGKINKQKQEIRLQKIIQCESDGIHEGTWGDNGKSYGWLQFQKESFYHTVLKALNVFGLLSKISSLLQMANK